MRVSEGHYYQHHLLSGILLETCAIKLLPFSFTAKPILRRTEKTVQLSPEFLEVVLHPG